MRVLLLLTTAALAIAEPVVILDLVNARSGAGLPAGWKVRTMRGQRAPDIEVRDDGEGLLLRLSGTGRAAWFYRELAAEIPEARGTLRWSWRVSAAPLSADMRVAALDDSPIRVYVVFGRSGFFRSAARIIFYSAGNAEPAGLDRASFGSDKLHMIRMDGTAERSRWVDHATDPFADYRRIWGGTPPGITAVGVMQDTDETRGHASADLRRLLWVPSDAAMGARPVTAP